MAYLTYLEKLKFEKLFGMGGGYVLDFSNRTFHEFITWSIEINIYDEKYAYASGSKANRLRSFWDKESNYLVGKLLSDMLEYWKTSYATAYPDNITDQMDLYKECQEITNRLLQEIIVDNLDAIQPYSNEKEFELLYKSIKESIEKNEPEVALDRLHTYLMKYFRHLCDKHGITYDISKPLHSLFGEYIKYLKENDLLASQMTERILKSSISVIDAFNDVRNNQSFAHDNPVLNYNESALIFNNIANIIKFIESIEDKQENKKPDRTRMDEDAIPF